MPSAPLVPSTRAATRTARVDSAVPAHRGAGPGDGARDREHRRRARPTWRPPTCRCRGRARRRASCRCSAGLAFADFSPKPFQFVAAAGCPGPWAKVMLEADFSVTAGRQFDRTATIGLGGATIYFGTTAEPSRTLAPSWHVERDLTELSALFAERAAGPDLDRQRRQRHLHRRPRRERPARLLPGRRAQSGAARGRRRRSAGRRATATRWRSQTGSDSLSKSFTPPTNVERAYLDVIAQSQGGDEFWYTCFPNDLAAAAQQLRQHGASARRRSRSTAGRPASRRSTRGSTPAASTRICGARSPACRRSNFAPYRVDLTPFAGALDNGGAAPGRALGVQRQPLLLGDRQPAAVPRPRRARPAAGGVDADTLAAGARGERAEGGSFDASGNGRGTIDTSSRREFVISGHLRTSHGTVRSQVAQTIAFTQHQDVVNAPTQFVQNITQRTRIASLSLHEGGGGPASEGARSTGRSR